MFPLHAKKNREEHQAIPAHLSPAEWREPGMTKARAVWEGECWKRGWEQNCEKALKTSSRIWALSRIQEEPGKDWTMLTVLFRKMVQLVVWKKAGGR